MTTENGGNVLDNSTDSPLQPDIKRMLEVTRDERGYTVSINPSSLTVLQTCARKAYYSLHRGLVAKEPGMATEFGKAIHKALEIFYSEPRESRILPPGFKHKIMLMCQGQVLPDESSSFIYQATRGFIGIASRSLASLPDEDKRSIANGGWLLGEYFETRINDPYEVYRIDGEPCIETTYETNLHDEPGLHIRLFGTVDCILENKSNGSLVVCDHKTTSATNLNEFYNRTKPNDQYSAYIYLGQTVLGLPTENFMINCFQVKSRPKTARGAGPNFLHLITKRTPEDLSDFVPTVVYYVKQYLQWMETGFWPRGAVDACSNYGACQFLPVCSSPESIKENIINANYEVRNG